MHWRAFYHLVVLQVAPQHVDELWVTGLVSALFRLASDHSNVNKSGGPVIRQDPNAPRLAERCAAVVTPAFVTAWRKIAGADK